MPTLGVKVDEETRRRLQALAAALDRTPHWIMKRAIAEYLEREERVERERVEDAARWEYFVHTGEVVSHEDARTWLAALAVGEQAERPG